jgi:hypothetical protein
VKRLGEEVLRRNVWFHLAAVPFPQGSHSLEGGRRQADLRTGEAANAGRPPLSASHSSRFRRPTLGVGLGMLPRPACPTAMGPDASAAAAARLPCVSNVPQWLSAVVTNFRPCSCRGARWRQRAKAPARRVRRCRAPRRALWDQPNAHLRAPEEPVAPWRWSACVSVACPLLPEAALAVLGAS